MHQGKKLKKYIKDQDFSFLQVTRRLGHGSKTTLHNWFEREELNASMFNQLVQIFPDIMSVFPDVEIPNTTNSSSEVKRVDSEDWKEKYYLLFEDYRVLSKKYTDLLEEKLNEIAV